MAVINVPRKVRKEGQVKVKESAQDVLDAIALARRERLEIVMLTERDGSRHGKIFAIKHSLINSVE